MTIATTIAELDQLLAGTSITMLTLSTPAETVTLHRQPGAASNPSLPGSTRQSRPSITALSAPWPPGSSPGVTGCVIASGVTDSVTAPCSGVFLHRHPLREAALVQVGHPVQAGAVLGLLQVGQLLLHITAPRAGTVAALATEKAVVGYGTALVHLAGDNE